ncbi:MAG: hypothetical protein KIT14_23050 [bacterium]|nr:hypothetical protein [bacterium]
MKHLAGRLLLATAVGHAVVGVWLFHGPLAAMLHDGVVGSLVPRVVPDASSWLPAVVVPVERSAAFWFLLFTPVLALLAWLVDRAEDTGADWVLGGLGRGLVALGVAGVLIAPVSGFWLLLALGPLVLHARRRTEVR